MTPASASTHRLKSHGRHTNSAPCTRSASYPPTTITSARASSSHGGFILQRLCGFLSSTKLSPSSSAETKNGRLEDARETTPLTPTSASDIDNNGGITATPRRSGEEFKKVFRYFDQNGDGKISPSELRSCMRAVGEELTAEDAEAVVESTDSDGDGLLGFDDFVKLVDVGGDEERTRDLKQAFSMYEMNGQGCITPKSLRRMLRRLGELKTIEECEVMIQRYDLNGDGVLSFDEFKLMML